MNKDWELSQEAFDALLTWLDSDREQAALKYEKIRQALIKIFTGRGCIEPEDLADETINRVTSKLKEIAKDFTGDRTRYFFGVAKMVHLEHLRRKLPQAAPAPPADPNRIEMEYSCLDHCIDRLSKDDRDPCCDTTALKVAGRQNVAGRWLKNWELAQMPCVFACFGFARRLKNASKDVSTVRKDEISGTLRSLRSEATPRRQNLELES